MREMNIKLILIACLFIGASYAGLTTDYEKLTKQECDGESTYGFQIFSQMANNVWQCVTSVEEVAYLGLELVSMIRQGPNMQFLEKLCTASNEVRTCVNFVSNGLSPCINDRYHNDMPKFEKNIEAALDFFCSDDLGMVKIFDRNNGFPCLSGKVQHFTKCLTKIEVKVDFLSWASKAQELCDIFKSVSSCFLKTYAKCKNPTLNKMLRSLVKYVKSNSTCNSISNKLSSESNEDEESGSDEEISSESIDEKKSESNEEQSSESIEQEDSDSEEKTTSESNEEEKSETNKGEEIDSIDEDETGSISESEINFNHISRFNHGKRKVLSREEINNQSKSKHKSHTRKKHKKNQNDSKSIESSEEKSKKRPKKTEKQKKIYKYKHFDVIFLK